MISSTLLASLYSDILKNGFVIVDRIAVSDFVNYCRNNKLIVFGGAFIHSDAGNMFQVVYK